MGESTLSCFHLIQDGVYQFCCYAESACPIADRQVPMSFASKRDTHGKSDIHYNRVVVCFMMPLGCDEAG